jgi:hypothetical protein
MENPRDLQKELTMPRPTSRLAILAAVLLPWNLGGCSDRPQPVVRPSHQISDFRVVKFAGEKVVVPFREGLPTAKLPEPVAGEILQAGNRIALGDVSEGEVFLALDLDALKFYHSTPGPDQLERFRLLGDEGRLFVVARETAGTVARVVDAELPQGLKAVELKLAGPRGGTACVSDAFVRRLLNDPE